MDIDSSSKSELVPLIAYPRCADEEFTRRLHELKELGVTSIVSGGQTQIGRYHILGKGCVGLVVKATLGKGATCALKIRRTDADRKDMSREVQMTRIANLAGVGPALLASSSNLIAMEYVDGLTVGRWAQASVTRSKKLVRNMVTSILEQCYQLDKAGLDHGELSRLDNHVIISRTAKDFATIVDFETASVARKKSNVTAAAQSIFLQGTISKKVGKILGITNGEKPLLVERLRRYKRNPNRENFDLLLDFLKL